MSDLVVSRTNKPVSTKGKFWDYHQNNSGGHFNLPAINLIIEAGSAEEADRLAEAAGAYFDGTDDCSCCGNRWHETYEEGDDLPSIYGEHVYDMTEKISSLYKNRGVPYAKIIYLDGRVETLEAK